MSKIDQCFLVVAALIALGPLPAHAYIGPGAGVGAVAIVVGLGIAVVLLLAGFLWYPLKRMLRRGRANDSE